VNQEDSTLVRILRTTKGDLENLGRLWADAYVRGVKGVPDPNESGIVTIDAVIRELLVRERSKMSRSRKNSGPRKAPEGRWDEKGRATDRGEETSPA